MTGSGYTTTEIRLRYRRNTRRLGVLMAALLLPVMLPAQEAGAGMRIHPIRPQAGARVLPEEPPDYTKKRENYIPEYEYSMSLFFSGLADMGSEPAWAAVPEFSGDMEEVEAFAKYIYQKYDYTGRLKLFYLPSETEETLYSICIRLDHPKEIYEMQKAAEDKLIEFSRTLDGLDGRDKVIRINNWIASNAVYDTTLKKTSCYDNVVEGSSTCNGYTGAFFALCSYSGVKCENVRGYVGDKLHSWNRVWLDHDWEYVDVTWNSMSGSSQWLLISGDEIRKDHTMQN